MLKRNVLVLAAGMGIGGGTSFMMRCAGDGLDATVAWIAGVVLIGCAVLWMRHVMHKLDSVAAAVDAVGQTAGDVQRVTAATSGVVLKTSERTEATERQLGAMKRELSDNIKAANKAAEKRTGPAGLGGTVGAIGVRLVGMSNRQDAIFATLRSLPCAAAGETTLPAQGNEPSDPPSPAPEPVTPGGPPDQPPSGVHASSNYGATLAAQLGPRSWTFDDPPPLRSSRPRPAPGESSEASDDSAADDDDETTTFSRDLLPMVKPAAGKPKTQIGAWFKVRAEKRMRKLEQQRQADSEGTAPDSAEPPPSDG